MKRSEQRCHRHNMLSDVVEDGPWRPVTDDPDDPWMVWKPCRRDGRKLVLMRGTYMTYGHNASGPWRKYVLVDLPHP